MTIKDARTFKRLRRGTQIARGISSSPTVEEQKQREKERGTELREDKVVTNTHASAHQLIAEKYTTTTQTCTRARVDYRSAGSQRNAAKPHKRRLDLPP